MLTEFGIGPVEVTNEGLKRIQLPEEILGRRAAVPRYCESDLCVSVREEEILVVVLRCKKEFCEGLMRNNFVRKQIIKFE